MKTTTQNGQLFVCGKCDRIHLEFKNIALDFSSLTMLKEFQTYILGIDGAYFESHNAGNAYRRKIMIPFPKTSVKAVFSFDELTELQLLVAQYLKLHTRTDSSINFISFKREFSHFHLN